MGTHSSHQLSLEVALTPRRTSVGDRSTLSDYSVKLSFITSPTKLIYKSLPSLSQGVDDNSFFSYFFFKVKITWKYSNSQPPPSHASNQNNIDQNINFVSIQSFNIHFNTTKCVEWLNHFIAKITFFTFHALYLKQNTILCY